jgi:hypothetical protein
MFGNKWYRPALIAAVEFALPSGRIIRMVTAPYFLATKLAAFKSRGRGDFMMSHDMEDFIAVLDGRPELLDELQTIDGPLRKYLAREMAKLLSNENFLAAVPGHLQGGTASPDRSPIVLQILEAIASTT